MSFSEEVWDYEKKRLERVLAEVAGQLEIAGESAEKMKKQVIATQKSMWEDINAAPRDLDDLATSWQYQTDVEREAWKAMFAASRVKRLENMLRNPYFGRIDFREDGEVRDEKMYIGISNLLDEKTHECLIFDWRAPVSSMFYDYETGRSGYDCPVGRIEGDMTLKRQYRIWRGNIDCMFDSSLKIDDEILQDILSKSVDSRMKTIVTSIQREQNRVIRDDTHRLLLVQGPAGSGKTSIALHRIAYLLYRYREHVVADNIVIFSPNRIFSDYISSVLPELGEDNMQRTTFMEYAQKMLGENLQLENMSKQMEYLLSCRDRKGYRSRMEGIRYKSSMEFVAVLRNYAKQLADDRVFDDVVYRDDVIETKEEISEYFHKNLKFLPIAKRLEKIRNRLISKLDDPIKKRIEQVMLELANEGELIDKAEIRGRSTFFVREEVQPVREKIEKMTRLDITDCYLELFKNKDLFFTQSEGNLPEGFDDICTFTCQGIIARKINYEDAAPLIFLGNLLEGVQGISRIKHVIIDEVQDYTPVQFEVLKQLFGHCSLTMLGDLNQSINPYMQVENYEAVTGIFGVDGFTRVNLSKSYRSTRQITEFCRGLLAHSEETEYVNREGELPRIVCMKRDEPAGSLIINDIKNLQECGHKSIALICRTAEGSREMYAAIRHDMDVRLVTGEDEEYSSGVIVIPAYLAKGLEFDAVLVSCIGSDEYRYEEERKLLYTVCTRALHRLQVYCGNELPCFIKDVDANFYEKVEI